MPTKHRGGHESQDWPQWVPLACLSVVVLTLGVGVAQRASQGLLWPVVYGLIALSPFVVDGIVVIRGVDVRWDPVWLFPVPVLVGVALLVWHPPNNDFAPFALSFMTAEVTSRSGERKWLGAATALASVGVMVGADVFGEYNTSYVWVMGIGFGYFAGLLLWGLDRRTHELRAAQSGLAEKAAVDERSRVAREVHDVIAHSMSVTMLHITAARMALERNQSAEALESLREAETQGRNSLNDIRRTVGLLGPDAEARVAPAPTVTDLPKLIEDLRSAGLDVKLDIRGDIRAIAPGAGLNIYRIAQESLTNAAKYAAGAPVQMTLNVGDDQITLCVRNGRGNGSGPQPGGNGHGLRGMVERAALLDGTLHAGADGEGWVVLLTAPRGEATP